MSNKSIFTLLTLTFLTVINELSAQRYYGREEYDEDGEGSWVSRILALIIIGLIVNKIWFDKK